MAQRLKTACARVLAAAGVAAGLLSFSFGVQAESHFPTKPVRLIVPFAPGGVTDLTARVIAEGLTERLKQPVVVENRAGASGNIGVAMAAQAAPDGYTLVLGTIATQSVNSFLFKNTGFNAEKDFVAVSQVAAFPNVIAVTNNLPVHTLQELIAYARANPGKLNYGSTGPGSSMYLVMEAMKLRYGLDIVHVPYRGSSLIQTALIAGEIQVTADNLSTALPYVQSKQTRALAVTSAERSTAAPDIPTVAEAGSPELGMTSWLGMLAPAKTPAPIVDLLSTNLRAILTNSAAAEKLTRLGATPTGSTPAEFDAFIRAERAKWGKVLQAANVKPE